jgi:hypothetical protein
MCFYSSLVYQLLQTTAAGRQRQTTKVSEHKLPAHNNKLSAGTHYPAFALIVTLSNVTLSNLINLLLWLTSWALLAQLCI